MSSTQFSKGPSSYGLLAEVKNWLLSKYDPQKEAELHSWVEGLTSLSISPDFQKGWKDRMILCTLLNKLQPGSVPKLNHSMQNWHQLENLSSFIKTMVSYGMNPVDLFEANDLLEVAAAGWASIKRFVFGKFGDHWLHIQTLAHMEIWVRGEMLLPWSWQVVWQTNRVPATSHGDYTGTQELHNLQLDQLFPYLHDQMTQNVVKNYTLFHHTQTLSNLLPLEVRDMLRCSGLCLN
ncbi:hypothetical protein H8959_006711 [Pygathrix nigripes]